MEATSFGARAICECFTSAGLDIKEIIAIGGVTKKAPLNMQILADVLNRKIQVCESEQCVALGASICAAVVAGIYPSIPEAQKKMASPFETVYSPIKEHVLVYEILYQRYLALGRAMEEKNA
jgi:L-ribulokinase